MNVKEFFVGIGHLLAKTFSIVKKVVPEHILSAAIDVVKQAAVKFVDNADRREWAVKELMKLLGVSESIARFAVELAVQHLKADVLDKAA